MKYPPNMQVHKIIAAEHFKSLRQGVAEALKAKEEEYAELVKQKDECANGIQALRIVLERLR